MKLIVYPPQESTLISSDAVRQQGPNGPWSKQAPESQPTLPPPEQQVEPPAAAAYIYFQKVLDVVLLQR